MSGHRHYRRRRSSPSSSSGSRSTSTSHSPKRASISTQTHGDVYGGDHRRLKRSSDLLPVRRSPASHHSWVLLNRAVSRRDGFSGDRTTSAISHTFNGEEISVSFELAEPPGTSVLTFDWQPPPSTTPRKCSGKVIAAHRDVVLLAMTSYEEARWSNRDIDLFVYQARRRPSLLLLTLASTGGPIIYPHRLNDENIGIMSCTSKEADSSPSFVVAELQISWLGKTDVRLFRSGSGQWDSFENLHVHGSNGGQDLRWWRTDAVVPYGRRYMIWVDYYRGMVLMDMSSSQLETTTSPLPPPRLWYVPLPVDKVGDHVHGGGGRPKGCRGLCITRYGIKFTSIDTKHFSNYGVGGWDLLKWSRRFRITTWTLREDDDWTWRKDVTMHEEEFWDAFDGGHHFPFPHTQPSFPVVDMDNPDVVIFRLGDRYGCSDEPKWMIEVDLRKKVLLAATVYSKKKSDGRCGDPETINSVRMKSDFDPIFSELPRYLDGEQTYKKRRQ